MPLSEHMRDLRDLAIIAACERRVETFASIAKRFGVSTTHVGRMSYQTKWRRHAIRANLPILPIRARFVPGDRQGGGD